MFKPDHLQDVTSTFTFVTLDFNSAIQVHLNYDLHSPSFTHLLEKGISEVMITFDFSFPITTFEPKLLVLPFTLIRSCKNLSCGLKSKPKD